MKTPSRVSSRSKLAEALGISRPTLYAVARLPDSPPARNGYWNVAEWRRFVTRRRDSLKAGEKEQLQIACLKIKAEREQFELDAARDQVRDETTQGLLAKFEKGISLLAFKLNRLPGEAAPILAGMSAGESRKELKRRLDAAQSQSVSEFKEHLGISHGNGETRQHVIVPFERRAVV
jgi:hypothetical protein